MAYRQLQKTCEEQFVLYPCIFGDLQTSRHNAETHKAIPELIRAIGQGHLSKNQVVVLLRDATRSAHEVDEFNAFRALLKTIHSNIDLHYVRDLLLDSGRVKAIQQSHDEDILAMSTVASQRDVTYTLKRSQREEDIQEEIDEAAQALKDSMSNDDILSIHKAGDRGDSLPIDYIPILREKMMDSRKKISAGELTVDDAAEQIIEFVNDPDNNDLFLYEGDALSAKVISLSRTSQSQRTYVKKIFDDVDTCDVISEEELGETVSYAPLNQTASNIAAMQHENYSISDMILVHDEQHDRKMLFKPGNMKSLALIAYNGSSIELLAVSTLVRLFTDPIEGQIYWAVLKKTNVKLITSYNYGFKFHDLASAEYTRLVGREIIHGKLQEALEEVELETFSEISESFGLDDDQKQLLVDHLHDFNGWMGKISYVLAERYEAAKTLTISDKNEDITSLDELTALTHNMSLEDDSGMSSQLNVEHTSPPQDPLSTVIARPFIPEVKVTAASLAAQEDDHGGKVPAARRVANQSNRRVTFEPDLYTTKNEGESQAVDTSPSSETDSETLPSKKQKLDAESSSGESDGYYIATSSVPSSPSVKLFTRAKVKFQDRDYNGTIISINPPYKGANQTVVITFDGNETHCDIECPSPDVRFLTNSDDEVIIDDMTGRYGPNYNTFVNI